MRKRCGCGDAREDKTTRQGNTRGSGTARWEGSGVRCAARRGGGGVAFRGFRGVKRFRGQQGQSGKASGGCCGANLPLGRLEQEECKKRRVDGVCANLRAHVSRSFAGQWGVDTCPYHKYPGRLLDARDAPPPIAPLIMPIDVESRSRELARTSPCLPVSATPPN